MVDRQLVFVAGASPQIITETAYALLSPAMPSTGVRVLTTAAGQKAIAASLFGRGKRWDCFVREHPRAKRYRFFPRDVIVLRGASGDPLADVRSSEDSAAIADQIARFVAEHTQSADPPLYASIAGGRKTMAYLLGAALMLYGRPEDRLSHVLVHPPEIEGTDFYFPPRRLTGLVKYRGANRTPVTVSGEDLRVELVDLPFPRLRGVKEMRELPPRRFSELVAELQESLDAFTRPRLVVRAGLDKVVCGGREVALPSLRIEIYSLLAERRRRGCGRPGCPGCETCFMPAEDVTGGFRKELSRRMRVRNSPGVESRRWDMANFRPEVSRINDTLRQELRGASEPYEIVVRGGRGTRMYGICLPPEAIAVEPE